RRLPAAEFHPEQGLWAHGHCGLVQQFAQVVLSGRRLSERCYTAALRFFPITGKRGEKVQGSGWWRNTRGSPTVASPVLELQLPRSERRKIEERRHREKDARIGYRLSALLWLAEGRSLDEVASLLGRSVRTIRNWVKLYKKRGLWASRL